MAKRSIKPSRRIVAVLALVTTAAVVDIIACVTAMARRRRLQERLVCVAIEAGGLLVITDQAEAGHIMVKLDLGPLDG